MKLVNDKSKNLIVNEFVDGRNNINILEDVFEAFLGAMYLDTQDYQIVTTFIINCIENHCTLGEICEAMKSKYGEHI